MSLRTIWLCIALLMGSGLAADVPYVFSESYMNITDYSADQLEETSTSSLDLAGVPAVSLPSDDEILAFPVTGGGDAQCGTVEKNVGELKKTFDSRVEPNNAIVRSEGLLLAAKFPGDRTIDQVCSIYGYLKNGKGSIKGWSYVGDTRGEDYYSYANETLEIGEKSGFSGVGDCDDFAILMSALVESIGGTTRIILAHNQDAGGHAYAEVYLGRLDDKGNQVVDIIGWLKERFKTDGIYTHIDTDTRDVWLNLDWSADHPGGPFYQGDKHIVLCIRDKIGRTPLRVPDLDEAKQDFGSEKKSTVSPGSEPSLVESLIKKGLSLYDQDKYYEAIQSYDKAIELDPSNCVAWTYKGDVFFALEKYDDALQSFEKAIELDPGNPEAWLNKGASLEKMGKDDSAIKAYDRAIELDPNNLRAWLNIGGALDSVGRYGEGLQASVKAIELDPGNSRAWNNKGDALYNLGSYDESLAAFERAIELDPRNAAAWANKGTALNALDRKTEAYAVFARAKELGYNG
ncbi:MAG: tetratricopeptide repeat protein [Methanothrix sp.]